MGSALLTSAAIANAFVQKRQFYPAVVYITKSNPSMAVLYIQAFVVVMLLGKMMRKVFFGQLRAAEMEMERSPVITFKFHIRAIALLFFLGLADAVLIHHAFRSTVQNGATVQLVFGFEYAILLTMVVTTIMKYVLHTIDLNRENPWENKTVYLLYTELITGFFKTLLYVVFVIIMIKIHTFPLFAIRPMYLTLSYPDATEELLSQHDNVCIICREEMTSGKKLPCNHIFHAHCLRSWFQRQQSCPTCRMDVLRPIEQQQQQQQQQRRQAEAQAAQPPPPQPGFHPNVPGFVGMPPPPPFPMWNPAMPQAPNQPPAPPPTTAGSTPASATTTSQGPSATAAQAQEIPGFLPPPPFMAGAPFMPPFMAMPGMPSPLPPQLFMSPLENLSTLSEEELRNMEGQERANVEARIKVLRNVHSLLDAAIVQLNQYSQVITTLNLLSKPEEPDSNVARKEEDRQSNNSDAMNDLLENIDTEASNQPKSDADVDNSSELRRRRLERFSSQNSENLDAKDTDASETGKAGLGTNT
eukprot:gene3047-1326_t